MQENKVRVVFEAILDKFKNNVKEAAKVTLEIGEAGEKASKKVNFDDANESVNTLEKNLNKLKGTLKTITVGYIGKKLFDINKENIEYFANFQEGMKAVHTLLPDMTEAALEEMSKQAKQFAIDMKVLPEHITPALYDAISAGVPDVEAFDFLKDAQIAARGGRTDIATSVDFLTNVVNAYGREVITAKEASDAMFVAMRNGKVSFAEMAAQMYSVIPAASAIELPFDNIVAAVGRMGAQSIPVAQATTQLGAFLKELSSADSKAGDIFRQATKKTLREFIAEGNNLQDIIMVMDAAAKQLKVEASNLFGSKEAGSVVLSLTEGKEEFAKDLLDMQNAAGATEEAYNKLNNTMRATFDGIQSKIAVFKLNVADKYFPQVQDAADKLDESLKRMGENGTLDRLAQSIGNIIATIITQFDNILNNLDNIIAKIDSLASFIEGRLPAIITVVKNLAKAFIFLKSVMLVADFVKLLANPAGIAIAVIGALIFAIIKLSIKYEGFHNFLIVSFQGIKLLFLILAKAIVWGIDKILKALSKLLGWIPGIGDAIKAAADKSSEELSRLNSEIDDTIEKIQGLNNQKVEVEFEVTNADYEKEKDFIFDPKRPIKDQLKERGLDKNDESKPNINVEGVKVSDNLSSGKGIKKKITIHDRIRDVEDKYSPDIDLYESRAELSKVKDDKDGIRSNKNLIAESLRRQANDLLNLQMKSKGQDAKIVEAARNKILIKIEETLKGINESVNKIVGDFNTPSDLRVLTEYQYKVEKADNKLSKRLVYSPDISMYLTIEDTGEKGVAQVKDEINHFTSAIFDNKNDLVTKFMQDVTRN